MASQFAHFLSGSARRSLLSNWFRRYMGAGSPSLIAAVILSVGMQLGGIKGGVIRLVYTSCQLTLASQGSAFSGPFLPPVRYIGFLSSSLSMNPLAGKSESKLLGNVRGFALTSSYTNSGSSTLSPKGRQPQISSYNITPSDQ